MRGGREKRPQEILAAEKRGVSDPSREQGLESGVIDKAAPPYQIIFCVL